jgi:hypothetical protein
MSAGRNPHLTTAAAAPGGRGAWRWWRWQMTGAEPGCGVRGGAKN